MQSICINRMQKSVMTSCSHGQFMTIERRNDMVEILIKETPRGHMTATCIELRILHLPIARRSARTEKVSITSAQLSLAVDYCRCILCHRHSLSIV